MAANRLVSLLFVLLSLISPIHSWEHSTYVELSYPPPSVQGPWELKGATINDLCPKPEDEDTTKRWPFPTTGGYIYAHMVNETGEFPNHHFLGLATIGQINSTRNQSISVPAGSAMWSDFSTGASCVGGNRTSNAGINATELIDAALMLSASMPIDLEGTNATIGFLVTLYSQNSEDAYDFVSSVYYCSYVTFIAPKAFAASEYGSYCRDGVATTQPGSTVTPSLVAPAADSSSGSDNTQRNVAIGVGVGLSSAAILLIIGAIVLLRRHRRSSRRVDGITRGNGVGSAKEAMLGADSDSMSLEPPPSYVQATQGAR